MADLSDLEVLGLVNKVVSELQNHLGVNNKSLAEFIIAQRVDSKTFEAFKQKILDMDDGFPVSLIESIDRLVRIMHPVIKMESIGIPEIPATHRPVEDKAQVFSGQVLPDQALGEDSMDDVFDMLESLEQMNSQKKSERKRDLSRDRSRSPRTRSRPLVRDRDTSRRYYEVDYNKGRRHRHQRNTYSDYDGQDKDQHGSSQSMDASPILHKVYDGCVTSIKEFGAFVNLHGVMGKVDGLVHVSKLTEGRVDHPSDLVTHGQQVKVKVTNVDGARISLSMKDVDQQTGQDLSTQANFASGANMYALGGGSTGHTDHSFPKRQKKRMTSPERWEIQQLIAAGVAKASDYPDLEDDYNAMLKGDSNLDLEQDFDIELREEDPPFLAGQTKQSLDLSPIRVIKAPEGSLNRAALSGSALGKERKELQHQEAEAAADSETKADLSSQWDDPMADQSQRQFASDLKRTNNANSGTVPEWKRVIQSKDQSYGKRNDKHKTIKQIRESLPIFTFRSALIEAVQQHQILIVVGETGSGKTTQTTQYLAEAGFTNNGIIGCTQPRRVAAISVAKRVAEEVGCALGDEVGYSIRFEDCTSPATRIKYMTDGMLQREILQDPYLKKYSVIMLDEAHERTIATDILFALLKKTVKNRPDLKVIVTSATLDAEKFSTYFGGTPIFSIPGRTFPVEIMYSKEPEPDYLEAALITVMQIHLSEPAGDILLFLTGKDEIDIACEILYERTKALGPNVPELIILPIYSALPTEMQSRIFEPAPPGSRKVVIGTNIAETSITIDDVFYVIDPGFSKQMTYDPKLGMDSLIVTPISQAQAKQRAGRAGRTGPGKCYRLYTEAAYESEMLPTTIPDIQRQNISLTILMLKAMGINDLLHFDFMDPPPINTTLTALEELYTLGALDDEGLLTRLGRKMTSFPMEPALAKVLLAAIEMGCSDEMLSIVAMLNLANVFYRPKEKQAQADQKKAKFHDVHGDHLTLLNIYNSWKQSGYSNAWCFENFIQARSMKQAKNVRDQLAKILERGRHPIISCGPKTDCLRRALCAGYFRQTARRDTEAGSGGYKTLIEGTSVYMHPSSALFGKHAEWVIYHEVVLTTREYMRWTTSIEPKWLVEAAPTFFKVAGTDGTLSKRRKQERIRPLHNKFEAENDWRLSAQRRGGRGGGGGTWG